jgi:flagellar hook-basal body complex protein FliE
MSMALNQIVSLAASGLNLPAAGLGSAKLRDTALASGPKITTGMSQETSGAAPFSDLLTDAVGQVSQLEQGAQEKVSGLMSGAGVDIHDAMIATQKASMSFELSLAIRNKAVQAYQQVMSMQF